MSISDTLKKCYSKNINKNIKHEISSNKTHLELDNSFYQIKTKATSFKSSVIRKNYKTGNGSIYISKDTIENALNELGNKIGSGRK